MKIAFFDTHSYDKASFTKANIEGGFNYEIDFRDYKLTENTALTAHDYDAVCVFVNDVVNEEVISFTPHSMRILITSSFTTSFTKTQTAS